MVDIIWMTILIVLTLIIIFALIILVGFAFIQTKILEGLFRSYDYPNSDQINAPGDQYSFDKATGEIPLESFAPDLQKPVKVVYKETPHGVEEVEEGV